MPEININKAVVRQAVLRAALTPEQIEARQAEFVISTEAPDSYDTVFKLDGWKLDRYQNNPVVGYNHALGWGSNDPDNVIGTSEVFVDGDQLVARITFEPAEDNPKAEKVFKKVQRGTLRMASVGAVPLRGHWGDAKMNEDENLVYFDEAELYEWSIVDIGSNPEALKRNADTIKDIIGSIPKEDNKQAEEPEVTIKRSVREAKFELNKKRYNEKK